MFFLARAATVTNVCDLSHWLPSLREQKQFSPSDILLFLLFHFSPAATLLVLLAFRLCSDGNQYFRYARERSERAQTVANVCDMQAIPSKMRRDTNLTLTPCGAHPPPSPGGGIVTQIKAVLRLVIVGVRSPYLILGGGCGRPIRHIILPTLSKRSLTLRTNFKKAFSIGIHWCLVVVTHFP
jgi:hypothetical protein